MYRGLDLNRPKEFEGFQRFSIRSAARITARELRQGVSEITVTGMVEGRDAEIAIRVLHPIHCLKSRVINILHPATRRTDAIARKLLEASLVIARVHINDALAAGDIKEALDCFRRLYWYLRSDEHLGRRLMVNPIGNAERKARFRSLVHDLQAEYDVKAE